MRVPPLKSRKSDFRGGTGRLPTRPPTRYDQSAQGEVAAGTLEQPVAQIAGQQTGLVATDLPRRDTPGLPVPLHPLDRAALRNPEPGSRAPRRHALIHHRRKNPFAKVHRIGSNHAVLASCSSRHRESHITPIGNP
jgi:hypothetical protein